VLSAAWIVTVSLALHQGGPEPPRPTQPAWTDDRPLTRFPQNLGRDAKSLARPDAMLTAAIGLAAAGLAHSADDNLSDWALESGNSKSYTPIGQMIGNAYLQGGAAIATYVIGKVQQSPEVAHIGSDLIRAQALNAVVTLTTKVAVDRERPDGGTRSFPSGHVSATFASAAVLAEHYGWKVGVPAYAVSGFIGWTRVRDRQHWLSDVVFGSAVGIVAGKAVTGSHMRNWTIMPVASNTSAAFYLVKTGAN